MKKMVFSNDFIAVDFFLSCIAYLLWPIVLKKERKAEIPQTSLIFYFFQFVYLISFLTFAIKLSVKWHFLPNFYTLFSYCHYCYLYSNESFSCMKFALHLFPLYNDILAYHCHRISFLHILHRQKYEEIYFDWWSTVNQIEWEKWWLFLFGTTILLSSANDKWST